VLEGSASMPSRAAPKPLARFLPYCQIAATGGAITRRRSRAWVDTRAPTVVRTHRSDLGASGAGTATSVERAFLAAVSDMPVRAPAAMSATPF